jgi:ZIP family zinc transporter
MAAVLALKWLTGRARGSGSLAAITAADILIDGLVLGIGFAAGVRQRVLLLPLVLREAI